jgi:hypothetical protein
LVPHAVVAFAAGAAAWIRVVFRMAATAGFKALLRVLISVRRVLPSVCRAIAPSIIAPSITVPSGAEPRVSPRALQDGGADALHTLQGEAHC